MLDLETSDHCRAHARKTRQTTHRFRRGGHLLCPIHPVYLSYADCGLIQINDFERPGAEQDISGTGKATTDSTGKRSP
jgi:hypothetical protein